MAIVAVMMVVGFSAFKVIEAPTDLNTTMKVQKTWYFTGTDPLHVGLPEHYTDEQDEAPDCDDEKQVVCTIIAPEGDDGEPDLSSPTIQSLIDDAMDTGNTNSVVQSFRSL